jgi:hypothetical protein
MQNRPSFTFLWHGISGKPWNVDIKGSKLQIIFYFTLLNGWQLWIVTNFGKARGYKPSMKLPSCFHDIWVSWPPVNFSKTIDTKSSTLIFDRREYVKINYILVQSNADETLGFYVSRKDRLSFQWYMMYLLCHDVINCETEQFRLYLCIVYFNEYLRVVVREN